MSKHRPHLAPSRPKFHQAPKRGSWRAEAVSVNSVFTYEFQPKRRQRCQRPPTSQAFHLMHPSISPTAWGEQLPTSQAQLPSAQSFFLPSTRLPAYLSLFLSLCIYWKKMFLQKKMQSNQKRNGKKHLKTCYTGVFCARSRAKFCFHHTGEKSGLSPLELMAFLCKGNRISFIRALYSSRGAINPYGFQSRLPRFAAPASPAWEVPDHFLASFLDLSAHDKQHLVPIPNVQAH